MVYQYWYFGIDDIISRKLEMTELNHSVDNVDNYVEK